MKNLFMLLMIMLMALPAALPWMPHGAAHALHDRHVSQHQSGHADDSHRNLTTSHAHHAVAVDIVTYFSDYLHVDLQRPSSASFAAPLPHAPDMHADIVRAASLPARIELALLHDRALPFWRRVDSHYPPIYFSTQRIRI